MNLAEVGGRARVVESDLNDPGCSRGVAVAALAVAVTTFGASKAAVVGLHVVPTVVVAPLDRISGIDRQLRRSEDVAADLDDMSLLSMNASGHEDQSRDDPTKREQRVVDHELSFGAILWGTPTVPEIATGQNQLQATPTRPDRRGCGKPMNWFHSVSVRLSRRPVMTRLRLICQRRLRPNTS